jgi:hypothetical protein
MLIIKLDTLKRRGFPENPVSTDIESTKKASLMGVSEAD